MNSGPAYQLINSKSQLMQYSEEKDYVGREAHLIPTPSTMLVLDWSKVWFTNATPTALMPTVLK